MSELLSPAALARTLPFVLFMVLLALRGAIPPDHGVIDPRWVYGVSTVAVSAALISQRRRYSELARGTGPGWAWGLLAAALGFFMFELWVRLTQPWMMLGEATASFHPVDAQGDLIWSLVVVRWVGASLMVPVMEELFWRSFLMRWIDNPDFEKVAPEQVSFKAVALSSLVFMLAHTQWLGALLAGLLYACVYRYTRSLWAAVLAHAVTNGVLGAWVVFSGNWQFW
jgi:CAAX prenyl protease-like protein